MVKVISIIIPVYNAEMWIDRCLASIYNQNVDENIFDVILVNDGSTDASISKAHPFAVQHKNLRIIEQNNKGVSVARNVGIDHANSDYILFVDADDELVNGAFFKLCNYLLIHDPIDMLVTGQIRKNDNKEWLVPQPSLEENKVYTGVEAYRSHYVRTNCGGGICRTTFLIQNELHFPEGVTNGEDSIFFGLVQVYARSIVYYNLYLYRIHEIEMSATRKSNIQMGLRLINSLNTLAQIKSILKINREQQGIVDFIIYQMVSNMTYYCVRANELSYSQLIKSIDFNHLFPLDIKNMYLSRNNARLMNSSYLIFYLLDWFYYNIWTRKHKKRLKVSN